MATRAPRRRDDEVLAAAARVFHAHGYAEASVQDVAEELGILKGSLYHYISTKEDLLFRLLAGTQEGVTRILEEVAAREGLAPLERLRLYVRRQVEFNLANLERVAVYYHDLDRLGDERRRELIAHRRRHEHFVVALIAEAQRAGDARPETDTQVLARCAFATIVWTYKWYRPGRDASEQIAESCADFVINGLIGGPHV